MMELKLIDQSGQSSANVAAADTVFGRDYNETLIHQVVTAYLANGRSGTRAQKDRWLKARQGREYQRAGAVTLLSPHSQGLGHGV